MLTMPFDSAATTLVKGNQKLSVTDKSAWLKADRDERKGKKEKRIAHGQGHRESSRDAGGHFSGGGGFGGLPALGGRAALAPYPASAGQNGGPPPLATMPPHPSTTGMGMSGQIPSNISGFTGPLFPPGLPQSPVSWSKFPPPFDILNSIQPPMGGPGSLPPSNPSAIPQDGLCSTDTSPWSGPMPSFFSYPPNGHVPSGFGPQSSRTLNAPATKSQPDVVSENVHETTQGEGFEGEESKDESPPSTTVTTANSSPPNEITTQTPLPAIGATSVKELLTSPPQLPPPRKEKCGHSPIPALQNRSSDLFSRSPKAHKLPVPPTGSHKLHTTPINPLASDGPRAPVLNLNPDIIPEADVDLHALEQMVNDAQSVKTAGKIPPLAHDSVPASPQTEAPSSFHPEGSDSPTTGLTQSMLDNVDQAASPLSHESSLLDRDDSQNTENTLGSENGLRQVDDVPITGPPTLTTHSVQWSPNIILGITSRTRSIGESDEPSLSIFSTARTLVCQVYLASLLLVPFVYLSRVNQLLSESGLTTEEITYTTVSTGRSTIKPSNSSIKISVSNVTEEDVGHPKHPVLYEVLKKEWERMIDDFVEEWRTLNIISAVLVPGILTMFQINDAANDPVTRSLAFWSLVLALWSLVYGCLYIIQFRRMRNKYTIVVWSLETKKDRAVFWNAWVMLALPAVSLAWSVIIFMIAIIWYMWRSRANLPPDATLTAPPTTELGFHIATCLSFAVAMVYFVLAVMSSLQYGTPRTGRWEAEIGSLVEAMDAQREKENQIPVSLQTSTIQAEKSPKEKTA
ncbi:hypothetical protein AN958_02615 [Leucoagaricus sp. SymC.cos]|nr:hypothetical protein AN958_02615 [Leucoagaricus sp. SymC.cos]